jgi:hypothetical protein
LLPFLSCFSFQFHNYNTFSFFISLLAFLPNVFILYADDCIRAARLDQDMIQALRDSVGLPEDAFPHLHLSPALRSPKARDALRQPLFASPTPRSSHRKWNNKPTPNSGQTATTSTTRKHRNPDQGSHAAESTPETTGQQKGSSGARRRKGGPVPEKLDLFGE